MNTAMRNCLLAWVLTGLCTLGVLAQGAMDGSKSGDLTALTAALQNPKVEARLDAVAKLSALATPRAVPALIFALKDADQTVRLKAAQGLGGMKDTHAVPALQQVLADAANTAATRQAALTAIAAIYELPSAGGEAPAPPASEEVTAQRTALQDAKTEVRLAAIDKLKTMADPQAIPVLITALKDADQMVRVAAAEALGSKAGHELDVRQTPDAVTALTQAATDANNAAATRSAALNAISAIHYGPGVRALLTVMGDRDATLQKQATSILINSRVFWMNELQRLAGPGKAEDKQYRIPAIRALGVARIPLSWQTLHTYALHDPDPAVRGEVIWSMEQLRDSVAVNDIADTAIRDQDAGVREKAEQSLKRLGWTAVETLVQKLKSATPDLKPRVLALLRATSDADNGDDYDKWDAWRLAKRKELMDANKAQKQPANTPPANGVPATETPTK